MKILILAIILNSFLFSIEDVQEIDFDNLYTIKKENKPVVKKKKEKVNIDKKSIFLTYTKNKKEAMNLLAQYKYYDLYIENIKQSNLLNANCCAIYIINIKSSDLKYLLKKVKSRFPNARKIDSLGVKYYNENASYSKYITKRKQKDIIDINKRAITITLASTFKKAQYVAKQLKKHNIYIYQTQTTKTFYYVVYAVNILKGDLKFTLKDIRKKYHDAYVTTNKRVRKLASNNFKENTLINTNY